MGLLPGAIVKIMRGGTPCIVKFIRSNTTMIIRGNIQCQYI
jgi:hypothetical protein